MSLGTGMDISDRQDLSTASHARGDSTSSSSEVHHNNPQLQSDKKLGHVVNNRGGPEVNRSKPPTSHAGRGISAHLFDL